MNLIIKRIFLKNYFAAISNILTTKVMYAIFIDISIVNQKGISPTRCFSTVYSYMGICFSCCQDPKAAQAGEPDQLFDQLIVPKPPPVELQEINVDADSIDDSDPPLFPEAGSDEEDIMISDVEAIISDDDINVTETKYDKNETDDEDITFKQVESDDEQSNHPPSTK